MNNQNFHPVQAVPPNVHALHHWDAETGILRYEYNGRDVITVQVAPGSDLGFRHGSDGSMQSVQYMQQVYLACDTPLTAVMTLTMGPDAHCLRPRRAGEEEAILGQLGQPLVAGVNGFYDPDWDLLVDWHGCRWRWLDQAVRHGKDGLATARVELCFSRKAAFLNLRPRYYQQHLGYRYHQPWQRRMNPKAVAGWCSWEAYRRSIDIEKIEAIAAFMNDKLRAWGLQYIQVDDGFQKMPLPARPEGDMPQGWLTCEEAKFPGGHQSMVDCIAKNGFTPAVWVNANITNPDFPNHHPEDVIWHQSQPLKGEWIDFLYSCTPDCIDRQVTPLFERLRELGYGYVKIDAIRHLLFDGLHECVRLGIMTDEEAEARFRRYMEGSRKGLGEAVYYLASWGEMHEVVGVADACRISMDANPTWAGIRMQLFESARWYHTNGVLFRNDPDHVCVRTQTEWARSVLSLISLSGQLYMLSDTPDAYTDEKLDIIRKTLPPLTTHTAEAGPLSLEFPAYTWTKLHGFAVQSTDNPVAAEGVDLAEALDMAGDYPTMDAAHPFSSLWAFHLTGAQGSWCVALRVATRPLEASVLPLEQLGLSPDQKYLAYDFWQQRFLGVVSGHLAAEALPLGHCQAVAFQPLRNEPQLLASDRHVSMDAVSVLGCNYRDKTMTLTLAGVEGQTVRYSFYLPAGTVCHDARATGAAVTRATQQGLLVLAVTFTEPQAEVMLSF